MRMSTSMGLRWPVVAVAVAVAVAALTAAAAGRAAAAPPHAAGTASAADIARLDAEMREQRQLIIQMMQMEQQHYDLLLKLIQAVSTGGPTGGGAAAAPAPLLMPAPNGAPPPPDDPPAPPPAKHAAAPAPERTATVTGKIDVSGDGLREVYVYVQNVRGAAARGRTVEIAQRDKQFTPAVAVVQRGTRVVFPNFDAVYHNVFSPAGPHAFDLGSYRSGDAPRAVELTTPGVVEVFCNMHSKMRANILVVPSPLWTRAGADGSFRLDNVPVGARKLVAWAPRAKPTEQTIDVKPGGAQVTFSLSAEPEKGHSNKYGLPYGSYKD